MHICIVCRLLTRQQGNGDLLFPGNKNLIFPSLGPQSVCSPIGLFRKAYLWTKTATSAAENSAATYVEFGNVWTHTFVTQHGFMKWRLVNRGENFTFSYPRLTSCWPPWIYLFPFV